MPNDLIFFRIYRKTVLKIYLINEAGIQPHPSHEGVNSRITLGCSHPRKRS